MVASELRIGNWILSLGKDGVWYNSRVSKLTQEEIIVGVGFNRDAKPIELSEVILIKAGFEKNLLYDNTYHLVITTLNGIHDLFIDIRANVAIIGTVEISNFKFLNQLQNLFHSLCGKELEINL